MSYRKEIIDLDDMHKILKQLKKERQIIWILLALSLGLRANETASLRYDDFFTKTGKIKKTITLKHAKKKSKKKVIMNEDAIRLINYISHRQISGFYFQGNNGKEKVNPVTLYRAWTRAQKKALGCIKYCFHDLRRTAISREFIETNSKKKTQDYARHKKSETTRLYVFPFLNDWDNTK